jgi:hypothetical protein
MSVDKTNVIDFVVRDPKNDEVFLVMVEVRDWRKAPEAIGQLHHKSSLYAQYVMSGALARKYPDMAKNHVNIRLHHFGPMNADVAAVLRQ